MTTVVRIASEDTNINGWNVDVSVSGDTLTITRSQYRDNELLDEDEKVYSFSLSDIRNCCLRGAPDNSDYYLGAVVTSIPFDNAHVLSVFPNTFPNKAQRTGALIGSIGHQAVAMVGLPFADSTFADAYIAVPAQTVTFNGATVTDTDKKSIAYTISEFPKIALSLNGTTATAQLVDAAGAPIAHAGAEIYFECTAGVLSQPRATTDATGAAAVGYTNAEQAQGKVKAGFKHVSGLGEVTVS